MAKTPLLDTDKLLGSHFTYELIAGILPGFTAICSLYAGWHWLHTDGIGVVRVLCNLKGADTSAAFLLFLAFLVACHIVGVTCTGFARLLKNWQWFSYPKATKIQNRINAMVKLSPHWRDLLDLRVDTADDDDDVCATKWLIRKYAVSNDPDSLVTTYHYKYHLYRALVIAWFWNVLLAAWYAVTPYICQCSTSNPLLAAAVVYGIISLAMAWSTRTTYAYYYERYWLAMAMEFCSRDHIEIKNTFSLSKSKETRT